MLPQICKSKTAAQTYPISYMCKYSCTHAQQQVRPEGIQTKQKKSARAIIIARRRLACSPSTRRQHRVQPAAPAARGAGTFLDRRAELVDARQHQHQAVTKWDMPLSTEHCLSLDSLCPFVVSCSQVFTEMYKTQMRRVLVVAAALMGAASAFSPVMMCEGGAGREGAARRSVESKPAGLPATPGAAPGMNRRESFMTLIKGAGAAVVGEAILADLAESAAVRGAVVGAEEVAAGGAAAEGAAMLRNG